MSESIDLEYDLDDEPKSMRDTIIYSIQWIVTMFYCVVWGYALVGVELEFTGQVLARYMATIVFMIGVSTLLQLMLGHRFTMVSGPNVIPSLAIMSTMQVAGKDYALMSFNAQAIAGIIVAVLGALGIIGYISKVWSNLVLGSMIMMVGLSITGTGLNLLTAQGVGWPFWVGLALALAAGLISIKGKGVVSTIPTLVVIVVGYIIFIGTGNFDWQFVGELPLITYPNLFPFEAKMPPIDLIITMIIVNLMAALNLYGNITGWGSIVGHEVEPAQSKKSFTVFGLIETTLAGILGVPGYVAYGENLGIITLTRVASRFFLMIASIVFIVASFFGPIGGFMAAMPDPIAGAILLGIASTVIGQGADVWTNKEFGRREILITGFSVFLSYGLSLLPNEFWNQVPRLAATVFSNPIITVILVVIVLEQVFFRKKSSEE
jgi:xanthine/uracil permease